MRISSLAKELEISSKLVMEICHELGIEFMGSFSDLNKKQVTAVKRAVNLAKKNGELVAE